MLPDSDVARVAAAVKKAEASLTAEIVPCVLTQSSRYPESIWAGAGAGMSLAVAVLFLRDVFDPVWLPVSAQLPYIPLAGLIGAALGRWCAPVRRGLIGGRRMQEAVERRAKEMFYDRGLTRTKGRDGVLIFASLLERRVVVLADETVWAKTKPGAWDAAVAAMTAAAHEGRVADGLVAAVERVAEALKAAGFAGAQSSGNELGDEPITGDS